MEDNSILGIITDGDLRRCFQKKNVSYESTAVELMTRNPKTISSSSLAVEAGELMEKSSINHLLVVDKEERLVGVVHLQDLLRAKVL